MDSLILVVIVLTLYMLPTVVAVSKHRDNVGAIAALNVLLGWTFIGWVVSLVWAMTSGKP